MAKRFPSGHAVIKTRLPRLTSRFQAPNPLRPGNYESLKLSSLTGSRHQVGRNFNSRRQPERPGSAGILPARAGWQDRGVTELSAFAAVVPEVEGLHRGLVPRSVGGVGGSSIAVGADFPPIDSGKPRFFVEGGEQRVVAFGLDFQIDGTARLIPGRAVGFGDAGKACFCEEDRLLKARLDRGYFLDDGGGREVVWQRIVFVDADVIERVPELDGFEFGAEVGGVGQRPGI